MKSPAAFITSRVSSVVDMQTASWMRHTAGSWTFFSSVVAVRVLRTLQPSAQGVFH